MATNHEFFGREPNPSPQGIVAWYKTGCSDHGAILEDMTICNEEDWTIYLTRTARDVVDQLDKRGCDSGFATMAHLLEYERRGVIGKEQIVSIFSEVLGL